MGDWTKEPWRNMNGFGIIYGNYDAAILREPMVCRSPDQYSINDSNFDRIVACVNAMQGIPDPEKFVRAFDAMVSALRHAHAVVKNISLGGTAHHNGVADDGVKIIENALDKALAAKPTEPPQEAK